MQKMLIAMFAALMILAGCGKSKTTLYVYNWSEYIDPDLVTEFEKQNDCKVVIDVFNANEAMLAKITPAIRDVAAERAIHEQRGWTAEHDKRLPQPVHHLVALAADYAHRKGPVAEEAGVYDRKYLVKAASLLVAAIDLIDRQEADRG